MPTIGKSAGTITRKEVARFNIGISSTCSVWITFQGQITKYVMRWRDKGGIQDLKKAAHFLQKYIEVEEAAAADKASLKEILEESVKLCNDEKQRDTEVLLKRAATNLERQILNPPRRPPVTVEGMKQLLDSMEQDGHGWAEPPLTCEDGVHSWDRGIEIEVYSTHEGNKVCVFCGQVKEPAE